MGKPVMVALLCAALYLSCDRGNTEVSLLDPMTHGAYAGSAFWSGNNFPEWVNGDILEDTGGDGSGGVDTTPGLDTGGGDAGCTGTPTYCTCVENALLASPGWPSANKWCACQEANPGGSDMKCECCWQVYDETAPAYDQLNSLTTYCENTAELQDWIPDNGCQDQ